MTERKRRKRSVSKKSNESVSRSTTKKSICRFRGCHNEVHEPFVMCYKHKNAKYYDKCRIHGKQYHRQGKCLVCAQMKNSIYSTSTKGNKIYLNGVLITERNQKYKYLFPYIKDFLNHDPNEKIKYGKITDSAGIYAIIDVKTGEYYYIGQSFHLARRREQHLAMVKETKRLKAKGKNAINAFNKLPRCYRELSKKPYSSFKFVALYKFPKQQFNKLSLLERKKLLCVAEQFYFDKFHPTYNVIASRKSTISKSWSNSSKNSANPNNKEK